MLVLLTFFYLIALICAIPTAQSQRLDLNHSIPPPPAPEPISITELPLPPVTNDTSPGGCTADINPHGTGCIGQSTGLQVGNFYPDGKHVLATVAFAGAPNDSSTVGTYSGQHVIIVKADNSSFPNGDTWKCITCGIPTAQNHTSPQGSPDYSYPQAFNDGKRVMAGFYIVSCGDYELTSPECTPDRTYMYTIRLYNNKNDTGTGAILREMRLHPDQHHLGVNSFSYSGSQLGQATYIALLSFNPSPASGLPLAPRYDLVNAQQLFNPDAPPVVSVHGSQFKINNSAITVGELRGFTGTGREVVYIGYSVESCNIDVFAADLTTGSVRRLTTHPGYVDPVHFSPDDSSFVIMDTRGSGRTEFMAGMRGLPPITDLLSVTVCSSVRNNGVRRFFQPWLLDAYGDRGDYYGQEINSASTGRAGSNAIDDPEWNGGADPWFSPDGTKIVYWQAQTVPPACGGPNPLMCYNSTEPGGRTERIMLAHLTSRKPISESEVVPVPESIPWAVPYSPNASVDISPVPPNGNYTLSGEASGSASIKVLNNTISVTYNNFSSDGLAWINGFQTISTRVETFTVNYLDWYANLTRTGLWPATQITSPEGFHMSINVLENFFEANGTLTTVADGVAWKQPLNNA